MARKFYETPEFKALRSKWYSKLEQSGFRDIEYISGGKLLRFDGTYNNTAQIRNQMARRELKRKWNVMPKGQAWGAEWRLRVDEQAAYYALLRSWLYELPEDTDPVLANAWELYADGKDIPTVYKEIKHLPGAPDKKTLTNWIYRQKKTALKRNAELASPGQSASCEGVDTMPASQRSVTNDD